MCGARRAGLALIGVCAIYLYRIGDVPLVKFDEFYGAQASFEVWAHGRFALPAYQGHLVEAVRTFFHPPGFYLVNALLIGPLTPSPWSVRLGPTLFAILSFVALFAALRRALGRTQHAAALALLGAVIAAWNPLTFVMARHARPETWVALLGVCAAALVQPRALPALGAGLLSGYAVFSHPFALVLPATIGAWLASRRAWRALAACALGIAVFAGVLLAWILAHLPDFVAEARWLRADQLVGSAWDALALRLGIHARLALDPRAACVWIVEACLLLLLAQRSAQPLRRPVLGLLAILHLVLFVVVPRPSPYALIAIVYFCAGAIPLVLSRHLEASGESGATGLALRRGATAALALALLVPAVGLAAVIWRDRGADYEAAFGPLREAVDRADPEGRGITIGSHIHYLAFWDRPFLVRDNPSLWQTPPGDRIPEDLVGRWRERGIRFVLASSLIPDPEPLGLLSPDLDRKVIAHLRATGRVLARVESAWYGEIAQTHRPARLEVIDLGRPPADPWNARAQVPSLWRPHEAPRGDPSTRCDERNPRVPRPPGACPAGRRRARTRRCPTPGKRSSSLGAFPKEFDASSAYRTRNAPLLALAAHSH